MFTECDQPDRADACQQPAQILRCPPVLARMTARSAAPSALRCRVNASSMIDRQVRVSISQSASG